MMERAGKNIKRVIIIAAAALLALCMAGIIMVWADANNSEGEPLFKQVLGKAVNFGIVANDFQHKNDLQSNFAVKTYTGAGHHVNPNLSGTNPGSFVIGKVTNKVLVTGGQSQYSTFYVTNSDEDKIDDSENTGHHATINTDYTQDQLNTYVDKLTNDALAQGATLASHAATYTKSTDQNHYGDIDTTKYPSDATIYLDGDTFRDELQTTGKIKINKLENQNIVFNFTKPVKAKNWQTQNDEVMTSINLCQFEITVGNKTFNTAPSTQPGSAENLQLAQQTKHIFFNIRPSSEITDVTFTNTAGVFLLDGVSGNVGGTSSGWVVTNRTFSNTNGEWHNIYQDTKPEQPTTSTGEKGSLTFTKTFDGYNVTEQDKTNITFTVKDKDGKVVKEVSLGEMTKGSDGKYTYTVDNLTPGNYTVTENNADNVDGYTLVMNESVTSKGTTVVKDKDVTVELKDKYTPNQTAKKYALKVRKTENIDKKDTNKRIRGSRYAMFRWTGQIAAADAQDNALLGASLRVSNVATTAAADQKDPYARFRNLTRADIMKAKDWKKINESDTDTNGEIEKHDNDITPGVYAVMEEVPPAGYQRTANPAIIRLNEDGSKTMISNANGAAELETEGAVQFLRWRETATNVEINKVDEKGDSIKGAVLAIYDKDGAPVETWTSDGTKHRITAKLVAGETYTLKELKAPAGYEKAADETFTVESKDIVGINQYIQGGIEMIDKTTPTTPDKPTTPTQPTQPSGSKDTQTMKPAQTIAKGVKTGDPTTIGGLIALIAAAGAVTVLTVKRLRDAE